MEKSEQLFQVGALGMAAFSAGKPCSPIRDVDFLQFIVSCGDRKVGVTPTGEAPTLELLNTWIQHWRIASQARSCPSSLEV